MMKGPMDIAPTDLSTVRKILDDVLPEGAIVWVFGSRAKWTTRPASDLDLAIDAGRPLTRKETTGLSEQFEQSDIPYKVDIVDWRTISSNFKAVIEQDRVLLPRDKKAAGEWHVSIWGDEISLEYGKALRDYETATGRYRVFGANGPIGWTDQPLVHGPGIILGRKGAYRGVAYSCDPFFVIDTAYYVVPKSDLNMRWLFYAIRHYKLGEINDGSPIPSTTRAAVYVLGLIVPPLSEQRAIAHILGTLDDKIELNLRMNETLEEMARALFKSWFVDFDPVRAKAEGRDTGLPKHIADLFPSRLVESELGEIPEGWELVPLYDVARYINGAAYSAFEPNDDKRGLPIVKIAELKAGVTPQTKFSDVKMPEKYRIRRGEILFSWSGNPDTSIDTFVWPYGEAWLNQHIFRVVPHHPHERPFVISLLKHLRPEFAEIARNKQTTGLGHVTTAAMKRLVVVRPSYQIMHAFYSTFEPFLDHPFLNELQNQSLVALRDTLLPKLISGELRVKDASKYVNGAVK